MYSTSIFLSMCLLAVSVSAQISLNNAAPYAVLGDTSVTFFMTLGNKK